MPHIHEKIDFTSEVFIVREGRVLLRLHDKYHIWLSVGGHIELDEDPVEAVLREAKEEVGLDIELIGSCTETGDARPGYRELLVPRGMNRHRINDTHEHITFVYFARSASGEVVAGGNDASPTWRWCSREDLDDPALQLQSNIKYYAIAALEAASE
ncbi:NUDIX domain-containing protein [Candidatus Uhrbacteria bacterium]|nr:NUDIX domain-containing protein [Candidatus Uhrbacteria bacterium]